jgi:hypothetical protein
MGGGGGLAHVGRPPLCRRWQAPRPQQLAEHAMDDVSLHTMAGKQRAYSHHASAQRSLCLVQCCNQPWQVHAGDLLKLHMLSVRGVAYSTASASHCCRPMWLVFGACHYAEITAAEGSDHPMVCTAAQGKPMMRHDILSRALRRVVLRARVFLRWNHQGDGCPALRLGQLLPERVPRGWENGGTCWRRWSRI